ncbi:hypothetical protein [Streptomyces albipurpureus]|uniref:Phage protein n=1 Tax=Streptomyces albipurpureus TaxID=2897419 RepID=A0ABT0UTD9_9ACTN|nr:hypothetical protein [Streptomyces sp. CWNU-1]MCM2391709.1 hypothetical protein [Streptomyces sp. CWNU-1]
MSLIKELMSETIQIRRPGTPVRDSTGSFVPGPPVFITVEDCAVMSPYGVTVGSSSEQQDASTTVTTRRVLSAPLGTDVRAGDRINRGSETYEVIGRPLIFPLTSLARVEASLEEVTG